MATKKQNVFDKILGLNNAEPKNSLGLKDDFEEVPSAEQIAAAEALLQESAPPEPVTVEVVTNETLEEKWLRGVKHAQEQLGEFTLSTRAKLMLKAACENVASNSGNGIEDKASAQEVKTRAALFTAAKYDIVNVLKIIKASVDLESVPGVVYSTCYSVQKAANFVANMQYRRALDPKDGEGPAVHDHREKPEPPCGLGEDGPDELRFENEVEHVDTQEMEHVEILRAYEDVHLYLQLLCELHGWDIDAPMPYMFEMNLDGTFTPIWGAQQALDLMEVRSQASRLKRTVKRTANLAAALAAAAGVMERASR